MMDLYTIKQEMLSLLETVGICHKKYSFLQAMACLQVYLKKKQLMNPDNPYVIDMGEDPMGNLLNRTRFNLRDQDSWIQFKLLLRQNLEPCRPNPVPAKQEEPNSSGRGVKRKNPPTDSEESRPVSPVYINIPPSPVYISGSETPYSIQEYSTDVAQNSGSSEESSDSDSSLYIKPSNTSSVATNLAKDNLSENSWASSEISDSDVNAITKLVKDYLSDGSCLSGMEYEEGRNLSSQSMQGASAVASSAVSKITRLLNISSCSPSDIGLDVACWADHSDEWWLASSTSELELKPSTGWKCSKCNLVNHEKRESCMKCQILRRQKKKKKRLSRKKRGILKQAQDAAKEKRLESSQGSCAEADSSVVTDKCIICVSKDANALIVHGQTAHNVCCYYCARKLQKEGRPNTCPACRRRIDRVIYILN